ncbi:MAG: sugar ABC transporter permease [Planctomycetes bacterium]|nr:sugar ABC transporter permease [Planctomycetota bacterium]
MSESQLTSVSTESLWHRRHRRSGVYFVIPALLLFGLMVAYPILRSFYLSFFDYSLLEPDAARFVGIGNYVKIVQEGQNLVAFKNTLFFVAIFVPPYVLVGLVVAMLLNRVKKGSVVLRTVIFTPVVVSMAVSAIMWTLFYDASFGMAHLMLQKTCAAINWVSGLLGMGTVAAAPERGVLGDTRWAMIAIALTSLWNGVGVNVILYLVGLQRIPDELYEAAEVDGAGAWHRFFYITWPQLRPMTFLVTLLSLIASFKIFGQPFIMTKGGPQDATLTYVMRLYKLAFQSGKFELGYASALAYALAVFIFLTSICLRKLNKPVD